MANALTLPTETLTYLNQTRALPVLALIAVRFAVCVSKWTTTHRTRRALKQLDDAALRDVGLTREQALTEAHRVFWRV
ncbi:MAG: DUF1127 domain-containing protein [Sulfitobacter sp.]